MKIYTIYDKKTQSFSETIFTAVNEAIAVRIMSLTLSRDEMMFKYAEDFDLYCVGQFAQDSGEITSNKPEFIINLISVKNELIKQEKQDDQTSA